MTAARVPPDCWPDCEYGVECPHEWRVIEPADSDTDCPYRGDIDKVTLSEDERRDLARTFHGVQWLSPERAAGVERIIAARLTAVRSDR